MAEVKSKQTKNEVEVIGVVKENKLKVEKDYVNGSVIIQYGDKANDQVEVQVYVGAKKKDGEHNKKYDTMKEYAESLVSVSKATEERPADVVRINGRDPFTPSLETNEYYNDGTLIQTPRVSMGFGNFKVVDFPKEDFRGQFENVVYVAKSPKMKGEVLEVEAYYINYKDEIKPIKFVVKQEELIEGIEQVEKGETIEVWGDVKIARVVESKKKTSGFGGKAKTDEKVTYTSELVVTGGNPIDEDDDRLITSDFVKKALVERETFLEELKKGKDKPKAKKSSGFGGAGSASKDDDLPF